MKRTGILCIVLAFAFCGWCQTKLPQVRVLESRGWKIQHSVMSWDSLSVYFSAQAPEDSSMELYVVRAEGNHWGTPERLATLCTAEDECWPSVSSDESMLVYVTSGHIWRAWYRDGQWTEPAPIIITNGHDSRPQLLEDNHTLLFDRQEENKKGDGAWQHMTATMMDDHNWSFPAAYTTPPRPEPMLALSGTVLDIKSGRALPEGRVLVYDATNEQLKQSARVNPMNGRWRVALAARKNYRIAVTAKGYSYQYFDVRTTAMTVRTESALGAVKLDNQLQLSINTYDEETQEILASTTKTLPLGKVHTIPLKQAEYADTVLQVNTSRPTVFTETELDIPMRPKKSLHHFHITNIRDGQPVPEATLRLDGKVTPTDTALRLGREMALQASAPRFLFYDTIIHSGNDQQPRTVEIRMQPLEKDFVLQLRNIRFEYDSYELTESSNGTLEALAQLLLVNPTLRIELSAHTDDQGSDRYNDRLSSLRGQSVANWLTRRGVDGKRLEAKGYGKRKPLVPNDSDENRALNRRVEVKIIDF